MLGAIAALCPAMPGPAAPALAGAWTLPKGTGILIVTSGRKTQPAGAMFGELAEEDKTAMQFYAEYGLTDHLTLGAVARAEMMAATLELDFQIGGHVRYRLWQGNSGDVLSVQADGRMPFDSSLAPSALGNLHREVPSLGVDVLYGRGWRTGMGDVFSSSRLGYAWRGGARADRLRFETTAGIKPIRWVMGMISLYASAPLGDGDASLKVAPSLAYTFWPWSKADRDKMPKGEIPATYQLGLTYDLMNPDHGLSVTLSVWRRF